MKRLRWFKGLSALLLAALMAAAPTLSVAGEAEEDYDPINSLLTLNMAVVSVRKIISTEDRIVLDQEYDHIINDLAVGNIADDSSMVGLYTELMDVITANKLRAEEKERFQAQYDRQQKKSLRRALMGFRPYGGDPWSFLFSALTQGVSAYFGYQDCKSEMHEQLDENLWQLEKSKIEDFNDLQKSLLNASWSILREYNLPDTYRITQKDLELLDEAITQNAGRSAVKKFALLQDTFSAYPPFWFYYGEAAYKRGDKDLARRCFSQFGKAWRPVLRHDPFKVQVAKYQIMLEEHPTRENIEPLLKEIKDNSSLKEWQDNLFYGVVSYYFGDKEDGIERVNANLLYKTETDISRKIYDSMTQGKMDEESLPGELKKWRSDRQSSRRSSANNTPKNFDRPRETQNFDTQR
ncbi:MAG: hypothetical protein ACOYD9_08385 [Pyramidobacter sp.]